MEKYNKLYHGTFVSRADTIAKEGILQGIDKLVYLCPSADDVFQFGWRWAHEYTQGKKIVHHPEHGDLEFPEFIVHDEFVIFEIDGDQLDWDKMEEGIDHNPMIIKAEVLAYGDAIPPEAILSVKHYTYN